VIYALRDSLAFVLVGLLALTGASVLNAAESRTADDARKAQPGPWMDPDVMKAAAAIKMDSEQATVFRSSLGTFVDAVMKETLRLMKIEVADMPRKLRSKRRKLVKNMDKAMAEVLAEDQYTHYEVYRNLLLKKMTKMADGKRRR